MGNQCDKFLGRLKFLKGTFNMNKDLTEGNQVLIKSLKEVDTNFDKVLSHSSDNTSLT